MDSSDWILHGHFNPGFEFGLVFIPSICLEDNVFRPQSGKKIEKNLKKAFLKFYFEYFLSLNAPTILFLC